MALGVNARLSDLARAAGEPRAVPGATQVLEQLTEGHVCCSVKLRLGHRCLPDPSSRPREGLGDAAVFGCRRVRRVAPRAVEVEDVADDGRGCVGMRDGHAACVVATKELAVGGPSHRLLRSTRTPPTVCRGRASVPFPASTLATKLPLVADLEQRFHETWLGMVQPVEGLVVSIPVLVDAQCMERQSAEVQARLLALAPAAGDGGRRAVDDLGDLFTELLGYAPGSFDAGAAVPAELSLYVPEGKQDLRPTLALPKLEAIAVAQGADVTPAARAGARYELLVWDVPRGLDLDKPETETGAWHYPPSAKFDRLLRHARVPIGLLTNREAVRLVYAPYGESSGAITFHVDDMASVGGRPILDAFIMLLSANRVREVARERALPAILVESRKRQANVTNDLAGQVFEALQILLRGFESAAERDGKDLLDEALARGHDHLYQGLLTVLLRLVFVLYAEDRSLLPVEHTLYEQHLSTGALYAMLQADRGAYPDSMSRRFGAWSRLLTLFRTVFLGAKHGDLELPPRHGSLFDPHRFPFLEGWPDAGGAPVDAEARAAVHVPTVDDGTILEVLDKLLLLEGQRLSYRALDVEQIGSVYEALMGYHVVRLPADAVCMRPDPRVGHCRRGARRRVREAGRSGSRRLWASRPRRPRRRRSPPAERPGLRPPGRGAPAPTAGPKVTLEALAAFAVGGKRVAELARGRAGQLVLQPGHERRRTSSHYTPRSLSEPIVRRTLEPLLACMGDAPPSGLILELKICDPAMGSGAFLVEACRFLAEHVVAAWTREGALDAITAAHGEALGMHARRLVAQRCLYGVDKNEAAVELAKLSLWLVTLAKDLPFTFVDHALRHGDSLVGLDFEQIRSFHWKPQRQLDFCSAALDEALSEAIDLRQRILDLAEHEDAAAQREKEHLLWDAQDALDRVRLVADVIVGAFFAHDKDRDREKERQRRQGIVETWLHSGEPPTAELQEMQAKLRETVPAFHWMVEFPEVFSAERPDPLEHSLVNGSALMDAFIGNPPFLGGSTISGTLSNEYLDWLLAITSGASGKADLCVFFLRRAEVLIGDHGTLGFIATNSIAQGETRQSGLRHLLTCGAVLYNALTSVLWPGEAAVIVSIVCLAKGTAVDVVDPCLNDRRVPAINSLLRPRPERAESVSLLANQELWSKGVDISGQGFLLTADERSELLTKDATNGTRILEYVGGEDVNSDPRQCSTRFAISFEQMNLSQAAQWPDLLHIVERRVRADRAHLRPNAINRRLQEMWWRFWADRPVFMKTVRLRSSCLVAARVTKHLCFSFQPSSRILNEKLIVFALADFSPFATLQSRVHVRWAWLLSSTMKLDLSYTPSDCFETFPFPQPDPRAVIPELEDIGHRLYDSRAKYMVDQNVGLTITYNRVKDPACTDPRILELRTLHEEMDRAVLDAYGWSDVEVPPYCPLSDDDKKQLERFEDEVIDRLFALNAQRAEEERRAGLAPGSKQKGKAKAPGKGAPKAEGEPAAQLALGEKPK